MIQTKSAFAPQAASDGYRILVAPVWPQGLPRGKASGCDWLRSLGPSENLRDWMRRNPRKISQFTDKYLAELANNESGIAKVEKLIKRYGSVTVLSAPQIDEVWPIAETLVRYLNVVCDAG